MGSFPVINQSSAKAFVNALRQHGFEGHIGDDPASRLLAATDNSVYQQLPALVLFPSSKADIHRLLAAANEASLQDVRFAARGGGTGTNGQSLTDQVVVDSSRHTNKILNIDPAAQTVEVEPGVVLGQLNSVLSAYGLFFPPSTSTASRVTIGGMIGTDACGKGSRVYGRTGDYIASLQLHLADGREITCRQFPAAELASAAANDSVTFARAVKALLDPHREAIANGFPDLHRSLTGYNLRDALLPDGGVDLTRLVAGAEGTLGIISRVRLRLKPLPSQKAVVVVRYADFDQALRDAQWLVESAPAAVETLDDRIQAVARHDPLWPTVELAMQGDGKDGRIMCNFVELVADSPGALEAQLTALTARLDVRGSPYHIARGQEEMTALWNIRSRSVGMLGRTEGARKPVAFVEDTAVPPAVLADYIAEFRELLERHGVDYAMFGHVDVGCLHVRPALDMTEAADRDRIRVISDAVVALVKRYRGLLWGEHGKGYRGEYTREFFGPALYEVLGDVKALFDPNNRMNPGKIVAPSTRPEPLTAIDAVPFRGQFDQQIPVKTRQRWGSAMVCNGNGVCFDWDSANVLCPSYKVTGDRVQSPKGRATLLREWLRQLAEQGQAPEQIKPRFFRRARQQNSKDFAHQVHHAMAGCLGCKACATQCPVHVNIPDVRSRFLDVYHRIYRRHLRDYLIANAEGLAPLLAAFSPLLAPIMSARPIKSLLFRIGVVDAPLPRRDHGIRQARLAGYHVARSWAQAQRYLTTVDNPVAVLPDAFTGFHEQDTLPAVCAVIAATGATPVVLPFQASGKALHAHGMLAAQRRVSKRLLQRLLEIEAATDTGTGIVIIEPSVGLFLRDDCHGLLPDGHPCLSLFSEWLYEHRDALAGALEDGALEDRHLNKPRNYQLFMHCTEQTADAAAANLWQEIFALTGQPLSLHAAGCCGMAGAYGHQSEHLSNSRALFETGWSNHLRGQASVLATGYSCRTQVQRFSAQRAVHPAVALAECLGG